MKMYILLCYILLNLHSPTFVQPKHPKTGVTLDLIHRYSPKSPFYNPSTTLHEHSQHLLHHSFLRYRHLKSLQNKSDPNFATTLIPNNGDYLMKLSIGDPPVDVFLIIDTGSDLIWVQSQPCNRCCSQSTPIFNPNQSSTYTTLPCNSTICQNTPDMFCDFSTNECRYSYSYGDGSTTTSGVMAADVFTLSNSFLVSLVFGCGFTQQGDGYDENEAGVVGLSSGPLSLISQLGHIIENRFSYCLTPVTSNSTGKLRLGRRFKTKQRGVTVPLSSNYFPDFYAITLEAISIGERRIQVERDIIIDSGSTLTYLDPPVYTSLEEALREAILAKPRVVSPELGFELCYDKNTGFRGVDSIVFHLSEGDIMLKVTNYMIDLGESVCLGIVPSMEDDEGSMVLGNVAQVNFEVEFNLDSKMVSFTPTICALREDSL